MSALSPPQSPAWELCSTIPLKSIFVTQVGAEYLDSISSWLGSSSQHLSPKVSINSGATGLPSACFYPQQGSHLCGVSLHTDTAGCDTRVQARPMPRGDTAISAQFNLLQRATPRERTQGGVWNAELGAPQPAPRLQVCSPGEETGLQVRRGRVTPTSDVLGDARPPG